MTGSVFPHFRLRIGILILCIVCAFVAKPVVAHVSFGSRPMITAANASQLQPIGVFGQGAINSIRWRADSKAVVIGTSLAQWAYPIDQPAQPPQRIDSVAAVDDGVRLGSADGRWRVYTTRLPPPNNSVAATFHTFVVDGSSGKVAFTIANDQYPSQLAFNTDSTVLVANFGQPGTPPGPLQFFAVPSGKLLASSTIQG